MDRRDAATGDGPNWRQSGASTAASETGTGTEPKTPTKCPMAVSSYSSRLNLSDIFVPRPPEYPLLHQEDLCALPPPQDWPAASFAAAGKSIKITSNKDHTWHLGHNCNNSPTLILQFSLRSAQIDNRVDCSSRPERDIGLRLGHFHLITPPTPPPLARTALSIKVTPRQCPRSGPTKTSAFLRHQS